MSEKEKKKKEGKKAKGGGEGGGKEGRSDKEGKEGGDTKSKRDKDSQGGKEGGKKNAGEKDSDAKGGPGKENCDKEVLASPNDPNALPPLDAEGNPIRVQPDPKPTFAELWFDDPVEGEAAQKLALELKSRIELRALPIRKFLEGAIVPLLLQGLQHLVLERPTNPAEYLAAFLLRNNPLKDKEYVEASVIPPATQPPPVIEPPKCSCCVVHCPLQAEQGVVPDFFRKGLKVDKTNAPKGVS